MITLSAAILTKLCLNRNNKLAIFTGKVFKFQLQKNLNSRPYLICIKISTDNKPANE
jgi:hypothetical protein